MGSEYRFLVVQALSIEDFLEGPETKEREVFMSMP